MLYSYIKKNKEIYKCTPTRKQTWLLRSISFDTFIQLVNSKIVNMVKFSNSLKKLNFLPNSYKPMNSMLPKLMILFW